MESFSIPDDRTLLLIASIIYALTFIYARTSISFIKRYNSIVFYVLMGSGFLIQSIGLYNRGITDQSFPLNNMMEILQVITWTAVMLEFILRPAFRLHMLGFFTSGFAAIIGLFSLANSTWDSLPVNPSNPSNPWISFHAALAVFSYGVFALLAITSLMHVIQHQGLRKKRSNGMFIKLPAITQLDEINKRLLLMGTSILTIAIGLGFANWAHDPEGVGTKKLFAALFVWAAYLLAHWLRAKKKLIASHFSWACIALFIIALLSLWPLNKTPDESDVNTVNQIQVPSDN